MVSFIIIGLIWLYSAVATCLLGAQRGGNRLAWAIVGLLFGPVGMAAAIIVPAIQGRYPKTSNHRWVAFGLSFGLFLMVEFAIRSEGMRSAVGAVMFRR